MIALDTWPHHFADVNGIRLHYVEAGPPEGRLVLLLHGFPEFWYSWRHQIDALAGAGYRVVAPDLRGYNLSDKPASGYDIPTLVEDIAGLIRAMGAEQATICGHDWGGALTWAFAGAHPEMSDAIAVLNAPHFGPFERELRRPRQLLRSWYMLFFQLPSVPEAAIRAGNYRSIDRVFRQRTDAESIPAGEIEAYKEALRRPGALTAALNYYRAAFRRGLSDMAADRPRGWPVLDVPALLIWGTNDAALGVETTYGTEPWVPAVRVVYIAGGSHWIQQERPGEVNKLLIAFLEETAEGASNCSD